MSGPRLTFRLAPTPPVFNLAATCAPAAWVGERSPRHAWLEGHYVAVERHGGTIAWRVVRQPEPDVLEIAGEGGEEDDAAWCRRVLRMDAEMPEFSDPVIQERAERMPGLKPLSDGSLFDGILTGIIGQSISLASAAAAQWKLAAAFGPGIELCGRRFHPLPDAAMLADSSVETIRASGVTWKRAEAIHAIAREALAGNLPTNDAAARDPEGTIRELMRLPMVGRWTAESVLLWGVGVTDCYPPGDVALLRAARRAYAQPDLTMRDLDALSEQWRPGRAIAARLLWTDLLGTGA